MTPREDCFRAIAVSQSELLLAGIASILRGRDIRLVAAVRELDAAVEQLCRDPAQLLVFAPVEEELGYLCSGLRQLPGRGRALALLSPPAFRIQSAMLRAQANVVCLPLDADAASLDAALRRLTRTDCPVLSRHHLLEGSGGKREKP